MLRGLGLWIVLEVMTGGIKFRAKRGTLKISDASLHRHSPSPR